MTERTMALQSKKSNVGHPCYTLGEEMVNCVTHSFGAGLSVAGSTVLLVLAALCGDLWRIVSLGVYGGTQIMAYTASTLYHGSQNPRVKRLFRIVDHATIYLHIAGTYTPFLLLGLRGAWRWVVLTVVWGLALLGIGFKILSAKRYKPLTTLSYVFMGWLSLILLREILVTIPPAGVALLVLGGVIYTVGVIFYAWHRLPYNHAIWHLFVLVGSLCHYLAILLYLLPTA